MKWDPTGKDCAPPATDEQMRACAMQLGVDLPAELRAALRVSNGWSDEDSSTLFYGTELLVEMNRTLEVREYCPGHVAIADDGGGRAALIGVEAASKGVFVSDQGAMTPDTFEKVAPSLAAWVESGTPFDLDDD